MTPASTPGSRSTSPSASPSSSGTSDRPAPGGELRSARPLPLALVLAIPAVAGTVLLLLVTRDGAYLSPDALAYVGTARNLVDGGGFTPPPGSPPLGNFAPLYTLVLAAPGIFGVDPLTVARVVGPLAFGGTIYVVGLLARRLGDSLPLALGAQALVLAGTDFLRYGSSALSEPLFLLLAFATLAVVWSAVERDSAPALIVAAGALAGATCLTRYVGLAVVAAGATGFVLLERRWKAAIAFSAIALAPLAMWFAWLQAVEGRATNRAAVLHLPGLDYFGTGLRSAGAWLLPESLATVGGVLTVALIVLVVVTARIVAPYTDPSANAGAALVALFGGFYLFALVADRLLFDITGRLDSRFMLVLHVGAVLVAVWLLRDLDLSRSHYVRIGLAAVVGLQLVNGAVWLGEAIPDTTTRLGGFAAPEWARSEVIDQVRILAPDVPVFSNEPDVVFFHTGRGAIPVPEKRSLLTGRPNPFYEADLDAMAAGLERGGLLVYFTEVPARRVFLPTAAELADRIPVTELARDQVGVAYRHQ